MISEKQREANRNNALLSTGPKSEEGVLACKGNALRHGLRSLQTVVPGEDPFEWEAHRTAILNDLSPQGTVEIALVEQVAAKLWRLGRVVKHEADAIANAQAPDLLRFAHEKAFRRLNLSKLTKTDIPTRADVDETLKDITQAEKKASERGQACRQLEVLPTMADQDSFPDWRIYEAIRNDRIITEGKLDRLFHDEEDQGAVRARQVRMMLASLGEAEEVRVALLDSWTTIHKLLLEEVTKARRRHSALVRRYKNALDRRRRSNGLPPDADLDRIQRYEAHLERGMHKALDRLRDLQEVRGAIPARRPDVAIALIQNSPQNPGEGQMGPFGNFALEVREVGQEATQPLPAGSTL